MDSCAENNSKNIDINGNIDKFIDSSASSITSDINNPKDADDKSLKDAVKRNVRSLLISTQGGISVSRFLSDYETLCFSPFPWKDFGFSSPCEFLLSMPDVCSCRSLANGDIWVTAVADDSTKHIKQMVDRQKQSLKKGHARAASMWSFRAPVAKGREIANPRGMTHHRPNAGAVARLSHHPRFMRPVGYVNHTGTVNWRSMRPGPGIAPLLPNMPVRPRRPSFFPHRAPLLPRRGVKMPPWHVRGLAADRWTRPQSHSARDNCVTASATSKGTSNRAGSDDRTNDLSGIMPSIYAVKNKMGELLQQHSEGVSLEQIPRLYSDMFGHKLLIPECNYNLLLQVLQTPPPVAHVKCIDKKTNSYILTPVETKAIGDGDAGHEPERKERDEGLGDEESELKSSDRNRDTGGNPSRVDNINGELSSGSAVAAEDGNCSTNPDNNRPLSNNDANYHSDNSENRSEGHVGRIKTNIDVGVDEKCTDSKQAPANADSSCPFSHVADGNIRPAGNTQEALPSVLTNGDHVDDGAETVAAGVVKTDTDGQFHTQIMSNMREVLLQFSCGLSLSCLQHHYQIFFEKQIPLEQLGYETMEDLVDHLPEEFLYSRKVLDVVKVFARGAARPPHVKAAYPDGVADYQFQFSTISPPDLPLNQFNLEIQIAEVFTPFKFFYQLTGRDYAPALDKLSDQLDLEYSCGVDCKYRMLEAAVQVGQVCACPYLQQGYHRVVILKLADKRAKLYFVDYGTIDWVCVDTLRYIPLKFCHLPAQALMGRLYGIEPVSSGGWSEDASRQFLHLLQNSLSYLAVIRQRPVEGVTCFTLWDTSTDEDININERLIDLGHAIAVSPHSRQCSDDGGDGVSVVTYDNTACSHGDAVSSTSVSEVGRNDDDEPGDVTLTASGQADITLDPGDDDSVCASSSSDSSGIERMLSAAGSRNSPQFFNRETECVSQQKQQCCDPDSHPQITPLCSESPVIPPLLSIGPLNCPSAYLRPLLQRQFAAHSFPDRRAAFNAPVQRRPALLPQPLSAPASQCHLNPLIRSLQQPALHCIPHKHSSQFPDFMQTRHLLPLPHLQPINSNRPPHHAFLQNRCNFPRQLPQSQSRCLQTWPLRPSQISLPSSRIQSSCRLSIPPPAEPCKTSTLLQATCSAELCDRTGDITTNDSGPQNSAITGANSQLPNGNSIAICDDDNDGGDDAVIVPRCPSSAISRAVKPIAGPGNTTVHLINIAGDGYMVSADISSFLWRKDILRSMLHMKRLSVSCLSLSVEKYQLVFAELIDYNVRGVVDGETLTDPLTVYHVSSCLPLLFDSFAKRDHKHRTLALAVSKSFSYSDPYWYSTGEYGDVTAHKEELPGDDVAAVGEQMKDLPVSQAGGCESQTAGNYDPLAVSCTASDNCTVSDNCTASDKCTASGNCTASDKCTASGNCTASDNCNTCEKYSPPEVTRSDSLSEEVRGEGECGTPPPRHSPLSDASGGGDYGELYSDGAHSQQSAVETLVKSTSSRCDRQLLSEMKLILDTLQKKRDRMYRAAVLLAGECCCPPEELMPNQIHQLDAKIAAITRRIADIDAH